MSVKHSRSEVNVERIPNAGVPLYKIPNSRKALFDHILEDDPDTVYRYDLVCEEFHIYFTKASVEKFYEIKIVDSYGECFIDVALVEFYVEYVPTAFEVSRALRGPQGVPGPMGMAGLPGECKCEAKS
mgnify:CR=1 FL=1